MISIFAVSGCQTASTHEVDNAPVSIASGEIKQITVTEAKQAVDAKGEKFIDVRTTEEYAGGHAARAINIPLDTLAANLDKLEKNEPVYLICETGNRSKKAATLLKEAGYNNVYNV